MTECYGVARQTEPVIANLYTSEVTSFKELEGQRFFDINVDKDNNVWFVSSGSIYKLDRSTGEFVRYSSERHFNAVHSCIDEEGHIYGSQLIREIFVVIILIPIILKYFP